MYKRTIYKRIMYQPIAVLLLLWGFLHAQTSRPERQVKGNVIISEHDPAVRIELPHAARYVGADRWVLYDMADCELHAFVEADEGKNVQRLYWVQFEGYLPTRPELHHTYDSPRHATIGGMDFFVDTWIRARDSEMRPGSDVEHILERIGKNGYRMPDGMMYVRLVHLLDQGKRKELMFIYGEDIAQTGFTAADLQAGGKAHGQWPAIEKGLIERAQLKIAIEQKGR